MIFARIHCLVLPLTACVALWAVPGLSAQKYTPPPPPIDTPCKPTKKDPCTTPAATVPPAKSMAFPFPGDTTDAVPLDPNANPDDPANKPAAPAQPTSTPTGADGKDAGGRFPFPGEAPAPGASSSSSSSSGSGSGSSSPDTDDDDPPAPVPTSRRHLPKVEDKDAREARDVEVSGFYFSKGDFLAAYNRGKDAVGLMPDDAEAHFVLAQAAGKLGKKDEARGEYESALKLDIAEKEAKIARDALAKLH